MLVDEQLMLQDLAHSLARALTAVQELFHIEDDALVDGLLIERCAAVHDAVADEDDIPRLRLHRVLVQRELQTAAYDVDNLVLDVPVIGHVKARVRAVDMMEFDWKIKAPARAEFVVPLVFHRPSPLITKDNIVAFSAKIVMFFTPSP